MSLDQNLFTLNFTPDQGDPNVIDLVDHSGVIHYRKQRVGGSSYQINVYDPTSDSLLITATGANATSKTKVLQLHNPSIIVELRSVGRISFRWSFKWEQHEFEWKTEECFMIRKPDPPVLVAVASKPPSQIKTGAVQIMDYNLNRFDIEDRKGLEIVILTALFTFQDLNEAYHLPPPYQENADSGERETQLPAPPPPPRPEPRVGVARIVEMQAFKGEVNEVTVEEEGEINDYAQHCCNLLKDDAMLFITIRSSSATDVPKVLQIVEQIKRVRHKAGVTNEEELHQYVIYEQQKPKGPKRINLNDLDDKPTDRYSPPTSLAIHLSKIDMPELKPRPTASSPPALSSKGGGKGKDKKKETSRDRGKGKDQVQKGPPSPPNRLTKPPPGPPIPANANSYNPRYLSKPLSADQAAYGTGARPNHLRVSSSPSSSLAPPSLNAQPPSFPEPSPPRLSRPLSMAGLFDRFTKR